MAEEEKKETAVEEEAAEAAEAAEQTAKAAEEAHAESEADGLRRQLAEASDKLLRTHAEYDNFRKRSQKEKEAIFADVKADTIAKFLPVIDNFERAAAADSDPDAYRKGIEMTVRQLLDVLAGLGVESFGEKGETFDPNLHNGVMHEDNETLGENEVADVFQKGYRLGDRVIRHATVKVAN